MRVIAGSCKGQRLQAPSRRAATTRPTSDRVKTIMFDILGARTRDAQALDLFAGTGALGIEALSRGASAVDFVESERDAVQLIHRNLRATHLENHARVIIRDAFAFLADRPESSPYTLVFADPPYAQGLAEQMLDLLTRQPRLAPGAWVVVEESARVQSLRVPQALHLLRQRAIGDTALYFYETA